MSFLLPKEAGLDISDNEAENISHNDVYKPSGLNQVFYDDKKNDRKRKHVSISKLEHILEDLKADCDIDDSDDDLPKVERINETVNCLAMRKIKQREEFEESTFTRTILSKKQKKFEQKLLQGHYIDPEVEGEEIMRLLNDEEDKNGGGKKRQKNKRKQKQKGFKKQGKYRKK